MSQKLTKIASPNILAVLQNKASPGPVRIFVLVSNISINNKEVYKRAVSELIMYPKSKMLQRNKTSG